MGIQAACVLAAGKGTRMHSAKPKVLQTVLGEPMVRYVLHALEEQFAGNIWLVTGHGAEEVQKSVLSFAPDAHFVLQKEQLGTGHALACALPDLKAAGVERVLVINGDIPLIERTVLADFVAGMGESDLAFATITLQDPGAYGRIVRVDGVLHGIVEAKDYDLARYGAPSGEVNAGLYSISLAL